MKKTTQHRIFIAIVFIVATVIVCATLPREKATSIDFVEGKPWKHAQLTATFNFAVEKSEKELQQERAEVLASQRPYYILENEKIEFAIDSFNAAYKKELHHILEASLKDKIERQLEKIYSNGIISSDNLRSLQKDSIVSIMVVENNIAIPRPLHQLYTVQQAYANIIAVDTTMRGKHALQNSCLNDFIEPNLKYDIVKSEAVRDEALSNILITSSVIQKDQKIIGPGDMVDEEHYNILKSYQKELNKRISERGVQMTLVGQILLVTLLVGALVVYLISYRRQYLFETNKLLFLIAQLVLFPLIASLTIKNGGVLMIIPFTIAPIMINVFLDARTAFITHTVIVLIISLIVPDSFVFILLQLAAGFAAIYSLTELTERSQMYRIALVVTACYGLIFLGYEMISKTSFAMFDKVMYIRILLNGVLLLFTYPLMLLYEKLFRFTSDVTLVELSNINIKLLRTLSENAPGTFQHSMQVSNLAAAAANKVGASSLLVRTGALYHDIGKLENPVFFTENQGSTNPHACLPYEHSARIIINHVHDGLRLAEKYHLPEAIRDFISSHHGKSKAKYFYISYKNEHPDEVIDESMFTYPGPEPHTMEMAILMMADAVEAASRSLPEYTDENISNLVDRIIDGQVQEGHFKECPITFKDISEIKSVFKEKLRTIYHTRISYPELKK